MELAKFEGFGNTFEEWLEAGKCLADVDRKLQWAVGDWWAHGQKHYGARIDVLKELPQISYTPKACADFAWVAKSFEPSRRRDDVPFTVYKDLAAHPRPVQETILHRYVEEDATRAQARQWLKELTPIDEDLGYVAEEDQAVQKMVFVSEAEFTAAKAARAPAPAVVVDPEDAIIDAIMRRVDELSDKGFIRLANRVAERARSYGLVK